MLDPAINRGMIDAQTALGHHFFEIAIAERITKIPANTQENDISLEVTPCGRDAGFDRS